MPRVVVPRATASDVDHGHPVARAGLSIAQRRTVRRHCFRGRHWRSARGKRTCGEGQQHYAQSGSDGSDLEFAIQPIPPAPLCRELTQVRARA